MPKALFLQGLSLEAVHHPMGLPVTSAQFGMPTGLKWNAGRDGRGPPGPPRLATDRRRTPAYDAFWGAMDTFSDKQQLEELYTRGEAPWAVWYSAEAE